MNLNLLVVIVVILLLFGGGGYYTHLNGWGGAYGGPGLGLVGLILLLFLFFR